MQRGKRLKRFVTSQLRIRATLGDFVISLCLRLTFAAEIARCSTGLCYTDGQKIYSLLLKNCFLAAMCNSNWYTFPRSLWAIASSTLLLSAVGALGSSPQAWANLPAHRQVIAQRIVRELPPPPPAPIELPVEPPPAPSNSGASSSDRYVVLVNGDSPMLLDQVRRIEPGAFIQAVGGRSVIQAGSFSDSGRAQQQVQALSAQGIGAEVISMSPATSRGEAATVMSRPQETNLPVVQPRSSAAPPPSPAIVSSSPATGSDIPPPDMLPVVPVPREVVFGQEVPNFDTNLPPAPPTRNAPPPQVAAARLGGSPYYVVIPGRGQNLSSISGQVRRLGEGLSMAQVVNERSGPFGDHVLVGPFVDRNAAERWNDYLRSFGMDARVYYRR